MGEWQLGVGVPLLNYSFEYDFLNQGGTVRQPLNWSKTGTLTKGKIVEWSTFIDTKVKNKSYFTGASGTESIYQDTLGGSMIASKTYRLSCWTVPITDPTSNVCTFTQYDSSDVAGTTTQLSGTGSDWTFKSTIITSDADADYIRVQLDEGTDCYLDAPLVEHKPFYQSVSADTDFEIGYPAADSMQIKRLDFATRTRNSHGFLTSQATSEGVKKWVISCVFVNQDSDETDLFFRYEYENQVNGKPLILRPNTNDISLPHVMLCNMRIDKTENAGKWDVTNKDVHLTFEEL